MDSTTLSPEKIELSTVRKDEENDEVGHNRMTMYHPDVCHVKSKQASDTPMYCVKLSMSKVCLF